MDEIIVTVEDGYRVEKYPNGTIVKTLINPEAPTPPQQEENLQPTLQEMQIQILLNSEYLVIMSELTNI